MRMKFIKGFITCIMEESSSSSSFEIDSNLKIPPLLSKSKGDIISPLKSLLKRKLETRVAEELDLKKKKKEEKGHYYPFSYKPC